MVCRRRRRNHQASGLSTGRSAAPPSPRRAHLSAALRRGLVDGHSLDWLPLGEVIKRFEPTSKAKYVAFTTLYDLEQLPGQRRAVLTWPYVEGLRMDEAMDPLTILAVGLYGKQPLPNQNGAPIRLVTPWKYGFKGIKSIAKIRFVERQPLTAWMKQ